MRSALLLIGLFVIGFSACYEPFSPTVHFSEAEDGGSDSLPAALDAGPPDAGPPVVDGQPLKLTPSVGPAGLDTDFNLAITSTSTSGFADGTIVELDDGTQLSTAAPASDRIIVTIPKSSVQAETSLEILVREPGYAPVKLKYDAVSAMAPLPYAGRLAAATVLGDFVYSLSTSSAGSSCLGEVHQSRFGSTGLLGIWSSAADLPASGVGAALLAHGSLLFSLGGSDCQGVPTATNFGASVAHGRLADWGNVEDFRQPRSAHVVASSEGDHWVVGGLPESEASQPRNIVRVDVSERGGLDITDAGGEGLGALTGHSATVVARELVVVGAGPLRTDVKISTIDDEAALGEFRPGPSLRDGVSWAGIHNTAGSVVVSGGQRADGTTTRAVWSSGVAEGELNRWVKKAELPLGRYGHSVVLNNELAYFIGGHRTALNNVNAIQRVVTVDRARLLAGGALGPWAYQYYELPLAEDADCYLNLRFEEPHPRWMGCINQLSMTAATDGVSVPSVTPVLENAWRGQLRTGVPGPQPSGARWSRGATVEVTMKFEAPALNSAKYQVIYTNEDLEAPRGGFSLLVHDDGSLEARVSNSMGTVKSQTSPAGTLVHNRWHHVLATIHKVAGLSLFVDGAELLMEPTGELPWGLSSHDGSIGLAVSGSNQFRGYMDEFRISTVRRQ